MPCSITTWRSRPNLISNRLAPRLPGLDASARHRQLDPGKHDPVCCTAPTVEPAQTEPLGGISNVTSPCRTKVRANIVFATDDAQLSSMCTAVLHRRNSAFLLRFIPLS